MAQVIIRNIDDEAIRRLRARAQRQGVSLEAALRSILTAASIDDRREFAASAARLRAQLGKRSHTDSTALIRADRDR